MSIIALVDHLKVNIGVYYRKNTDIEFSDSFLTFRPAGGSPHTIQIMVNFNRKHYECVLSRTTTTIASPLLIEVVLIDS
jgi:hypothetical protein